MLRDDAPWSPMLCLWERREYQVPGHFQTGGFGPMHVRAIDRMPVAMHRTSGGGTFIRPCVSLLSLLPAPPSLMPGMFNIAQMKNRPMILIGG